MTDDDLRRRLDCITGDIQHHETRIALVERDAEYMTTETAKIQKAVEEQKDIVSKMTVDMRVMMFKFSVLIALAVGLIEIGVKIYEATKK